MSTKSNNSSLFYKPLYIPAFKYEFFSQQMQQIPFPVQGAGQSQPQPSAMSYMNALMSPDQIPSSQQVYNVPPSPLSNPPSWMADLIKDVKEINLSMAKLDKIEQTVNMISLKVSRYKIQETLFKVGTQF